MPTSADTKRLVLKAMHDHPLAGHLGVTKTIKAINSPFFWRNARQEVCDHIRHCSSCQLQISHSSKPTGLLQPLEVPPFAWHTVTTDYITGLLVTADGHNAIAVFVDKLTKCLALTHLMLLTGKTCIFSMLSSMRDCLMSQFLTEVLI